MNLDGSAVLHADRDRVWSVITDPAAVYAPSPTCTGATNMLSAPVRA